MGTKRLNSLQDLILDSAGRLQLAVEVTVGPMKRLVSQTDLILTDDGKLIVSIDPADLPQPEAWDPTTATGYDATKTQTFKNVNGTLTWVTDVVTP